MTRFTMATPDMYFSNPQQSRWVTLANNVIAPLWYSLRQWFAVFLITVGTLYASVLFSMQHDIFPAYIAIPIAVGITWTYLSGLAFATATTSKSVWSTPMILVGAITDGLFGILYILGKYNIIPEKPADSTAVWLASAHIVPLILLLIIFTYCKRNYLAERAAIAKAALDLTTQREQDQYDYDKTLRDIKLQLQVKREEIKLQALSSEPVKSIDAKTCDNCGNALSVGMYGAMKRYGYCEKCKPNMPK